MSYIVNFTDKDNKAPITVYDNTSSADTSLTFPGRNVTGYGQTIAENFLHLLENFASEAEPVAPIEGQLWYDAQAQDLKVWDNTTWKAASGIRKGPQRPDVANSSVGELWIDTTNQQLKMFTGSRWLLVGPDASTIDGLKYGPAVEQIADTENFTQNIIVFYIADIPLVIFSKVKFVPKIEILGFPIINPGVNVNAPNVTELAETFGGNTPKLTGLASSAENLRVAGTDIASNKFMRVDVENTTSQRINIRNNSGITIGSEGNLRITNGVSSARIYNSLGGSSIDLQLNRNGLPDTILRIADNNGGRIGVNTTSPRQALDVTGEIISTGKLTIESSLLATENLQNGSIVSAGGAALAGNLVVGENLDMIGGTIQSCHITPRAHNVYNLGEESQRFNTVNARIVKADTIYANVVGTIDGIVTVAARLDDSSTFKLKGDVESNIITFDGTQSVNEFQTSLTSNIVVGKPQPTPDVSLASDQLLVYRTETSVETPAGLYKQSRDSFIGDLAVPIGGIIPYAGVNPPEGYLMCDGSEVEIAKYPELYSLIGTIYNGTAALVGTGTYRLPDLRGRFALGRDNMDNGGSVPSPLGGVVDAGGGQANRVADIQADILGGDGGNAEVTLTKANLPDHKHNMKTPDGVQFNAVRVDSAYYSPAGSGLGPTAVNQAQYLADSGTIAKDVPTEQFSQPVGVVNPFLAINYIIRSGRPVI